MKPDERAKLKAVLVEMGVTDTPDSYPQDSLLIESILQYVAGLSLSDSLAKTKELGHVALFVVKNIFPAAGDVQMTTLYEWSAICRIMNDLMEKKQ